MLAVVTRIRRCEVRTANLLYEGQSWRKGARREARTFKEDDKVSEKSEARGAKRELISERLGWTEGKCEARGAKRELLKRKA